LLIKDHQIIAVAEAPSRQQFNLKVAMECVMPRIVQTFVKLNHSDVFPIGSDRESGGFPVIAAMQASKSSLTPG
jgi:hypothetical protein